MKINNEEKSLKRFLKNKFSFNLETMVKFLITGTLAFSLTACGGGGGSSTSVRKEVSSTISEIKHLVKETENTIHDSEDFIHSVEEIKRKVDKKEIKAEKDLKELEKAYEELEKNRKDFEDKYKLSVKEKDEIDTKMEELEEKIKNVKSEVKKEIVNQKKEFDITGKTYEVEDKTKDKILVGTITGGEGYPNLYEELEKKYNLKEEELDPNSSHYEEDVKEREEEEKEDRKTKIGLLIKDKSFKTISKANINMSKTDKNQAFGVWAIESDFENLGKINIGKKEAKKNKYSIGILGLNSNIVNSGTITLNGINNKNDENEDTEEAIAINAIQSDSKLGKSVINKGIIKGLGDVGGIYIGNGMTAINEKEGKIELDGENAGALGADNANLINKGSISVSGSNSVGISLEVADDDDELEPGNFILENYSNISISGTASTGMRAGAYTHKKNDKNTVIMKNYGDISINGKNEKVNKAYSIGDNKYIKVIGMEILGKSYFDKNDIRHFVKDNAYIAENHGTITIEDEGIGMAAFEGATAINAADGTIIIKGEGYRMVAKKGATVEDKDKKDIYFIEEKVDIKKAAMYADEHSTIKNLGTIKIDNELPVKLSKNSSYLVNTDRSANFGKVRARSMEIDGEVNVSSELIKGSHKKEYALNNIFVAEDELKVGENFNVKTDNVLYATRAAMAYNTVSLKMTKEKELKDFTSSYLKDTANIFDKAMLNYDNLSEEAKDIVDSIETETSEEIDKSVETLTPVMYSNLGRQISSTSEIFNIKGITAIKTLGTNKYNFILVGDYRNIEKNKFIESYKTNLSGFVGAVDLDNNLYGTFGYGYNDINYKNTGNGYLQTLHLGIDKFKKYNKLNLQFGLSAEYNFHKNTREIKDLNKIAKAKFNSYGLRSYIKVSEKFGDNIYIKPFTRLDLAYMAHNSFKESGAGVLNSKFDSQNYFSVLPRVGFEIGTSFNNIKLFGGVDYAYELGNMNKKEEFSFEGFGTKAKLSQGDKEKGRISTKVGARFNTANLSFEANIGKEFGRRDNTFVNLSIGYKF